ncbi:efflux RND transporter periplasmic adaptor subunit [Desulfobacterium sp. N47]|uniref:efflux RND transporter periplasmic adaptor subunit n=1 Tax=Desulfobacterium sp. N47 TaxID=3115210 RepID=UPI003CAC23E0
MLKRIVISSFIVVLLVTLSGCKEKIEPGNSEEKKDAAVKAVVMEAQVVNQPFLYETTGTIHAITESTLSSKLLAEIQKINVKEGDLIKKGDELVLLDNSQVKAQLQQAEQAKEEALNAHAAAISATDSARAAAKLAGDTYKRYSNLYNDNATSKQDFEDIETKNSQAGAGLLQAEAMVQAAGNRIKQAEAAVLSAKSFDKDSVIYAPYNGLVTAKMMEPGDLASPGAPILGVEETQSYYVEFVIPEALAKSIEMGKKINIIIPASNDLLLEGRVYTTSQAADSTTGSFMFKASFPLNKSVRSGVYAKVSVPIGDVNMLSIPPSALIYQGQLTGIYIVDDQNMARFRVIRTGRIFEKSVEILSGLNPKDRYISNPGINITDGVKVETFS